MFFYPFEKYEFYSDGKGKVIAVSTYAGRTVKGSAQVHPNDDFDLEKVKRIAAARCNEKVARKRCYRATDQVLALEKELNTLLKKYEKACSYMQDATDAYVLAVDELKEIEANS